MNKYVTAIAALMLGITVTAADNKEQAEKLTPLTVAVLDFSTTDIKGLNFLAKPDFTPMVRPQEKTAEAGSNYGSDWYMNGVIGAVNAYDNAYVREKSFDWELAQKQFDWARWQQIYEKTVNGEARPVVLAADYFGSYLGSYAGEFNCLDSQVVAAAVQKLAQEPDFPQDFYQKLAKATGLTHLISGTVADMRIKEKSFKGYGVETSTKIYELDVIIKIIDLKTQQNCYGNVYTGVYKEQQPYSAEFVDKNIFQSTLSSALKTAAADFHKQFENKKFEPAKKVEPKPDYLLGDMFMEDPGTLKQ